MKSVKVHHAQLVSLSKRLSQKQIAVLVALGYSNRYIRAAVKVTDSEIQSVVRSTGITRRQYRDGLSPVAKWVGAKAQQSAVKYVEPRLLQ